MPRGPPEDALEALIKEARRRTRHRRQLYGAVLLAAVSGGLGLYALIANRTGGTAAPERQPRLVGLGPERFHPGQFWYTRSVSWQGESQPAGGMIERHGRRWPRGPQVRFDFRVSEETWEGLDGTFRDRAVISGVHFASATGRRHWALYGRPIPNFNRLWLGWMSHDGIVGPGGRFPLSIWGSQWGEWSGTGGWDVGDSLFTYRQLLSLPTTPVALRSRLAMAERALGRRAHEASPRGILGAVTEAGAGNDMTELSPLPGTLGELSDIGGLLMAPLPASLRLALFHVALTLPFVKIDRRAHDALGRPGVAVSVSRGHGRIVPFDELIFDPVTGALLGQAPHVAVVARGVVGSPYALPRGVTPIRSSGAPAPPPTVSISPSVGTPATRFKVRLSSAARVAPRHPPNLSWALIGTPRDGCLGGYLPQPAPLVASSSTRTGDRLTYSYSLAPPGVGAWCRGRYELNVVPERRGLPVGMDDLPNLIAGVGSSVMFRVR